MVAPDELVSVWDAVEDFHTPTDIPWETLLRALWADARSRSEVIALIADIATRGRAEIPIEVDRCVNCRRRRVRDGVRRMTALWALMLPVPVIYRPVPACKGC